MPSPVKLALTQDQIDFIAQLARGKHMDYWRHARTVRTLMKKQIVHYENWKAVLTPAGVILARALRALLPPSHHKRAKPR